jgi:hypothetical protein
MVPGMAPPPGPYMPGPFVQPMPYPPNMPPPNGEYRLGVDFLSLNFPFSGYVRVTADGSDATYVPNLQF